MLSRVDGDDQFLDLVVLEPDKFAVVQSVIVPRAYHFGALQAVLVLDQLAVEVMSLQEALYGVVVATVDAQELQRVSCFGCHNSISDN